MKLRWRKRKSVEANFSRVMPGVVRDFFVRGRQAAQADKPEDLHQFRLAAKQFRYTIELLKPAYPSEVDDYIAQLKELQDHLGRVNDCLTTIALLPPDLPAETRTFREFLTQQERAETEAFRQFWRGFDRHTIEERWVSFLSTASQ